MKIVRMVDFFERKFERKEENDFGMLFGITGFMLGGIRFILIGIIVRAVGFVPMNVRSNVSL